MQLPLPQNITRVRTSVFVRCVPPHCVVGKVDKLFGRCTADRAVVDNVPRNAIDVSGTWRAWWARDDRAAAAATQRAHGPHWRPTRYVCALDKLEQLQRYTTNVSGLAAATNVSGLAAENSISIKNLYS